jgi:hypothetical protein
MTLPGTAAIDTRAALELVEAIKKARSVAEVQRLGAELVRVIAADPADLPSNAS